LKTYDETLGVLRRALSAARVGHLEKIDAFRRLDRMTSAVEDNLSPLADFEAALVQARASSPSHGGRSVARHSPSRARVRQLPFGFAADPSR